MTGRSEWLRVSERGHYHAIVSRRPTGVIETACGRVFTADKAVTEAVGAAPGPVCRRCLPTKVLTGVLS